MSDPATGSKPKNPVVTAVRSQRITAVKPAVAKPAAATPIPPIAVPRTRPVAVPNITTFDHEEKTDPGLEIPHDFSETEKTDPNLAIPQFTSPPSEFQLDDIPSLSEPNHREEQPKSNRKMPDMGPLAVLMKDPTITEVMVNDARTVMVERKGRIEPAYADGRKIFDGEDDVMRVIRNIMDATGKFVTAEQPYVDASLPDGSRVNVVIPPVALDGPSITIRKFPEKRLNIHDLLATDALDKKMAFFLKACVGARLNILISGGTGSGKTTLLNVLTQFIPEEERVVLIEDTSEVILNRPNKVRLQTKPATPTTPAVSSRDLLANALRMRPDRVIVGECRRAEAFDMLQAMNTGHSGSMTTVHANTPRDALARIETLCMMAGTDIPLSAMRRQMVSAVDLVIQISRFRSGERKIVSITEVTGMEGEVVTMQDIFIFQLSPQAAQSAEEGFFRCTGFVPKFVDQLKDSGVDLPPDFFM